MTKKFTDRLLMVVALFNNMVLIKLYNMLQSADSETELEQSQIAQNVIKFDAAVTSGRAINFAFIAFWIKTWMIIQFY